MCVYQGFGKTIVRKVLGKAIYRKDMRAKGLRHKSQWVKYRIYEATEQTDGKHDKNKKQPSKWQRNVQNQAGVERGVGRVEHNVRKNEHETKKS